MRCMVQKDNLEKIIKDSNLSVSALERRANLSRNTIQNILYGKIKTPSIETIRSIASALNCKIEDILSNQNFILETADEKTNWDSLLYKKSLDAVEQEIINHSSKVLFYETIIPIANDTYMYSIHNGLKEPDLKIIKWLIKKK